MEPVDGCWKAAVCERIAGSLARTRGVVACALEVQKLVEAMFAGVKPWWTAGKFSRGVCLDDAAR
jgi:hypothetical protein